MSRGKVSKRLSLLAAIAAAFGAFLIFGAGNAFAFSCVVDGDEAEISMNNETITISKGNLSRILVNGTQCGGATASNIDTIEILGSDDPSNQNDIVIIDMGGGRFEPGTNDESGLNEIDFELDEVDDLTILGNAAADTINIGSATIGGEI